MGVGLKVLERLFVVTALGEREIQLCLGDITALSTNDAVDFVFVSAFLGDYSPMRGTVLGALYHNLGISVRTLAKSKKEDLRQKFNCWISLPLEAHLPYRQLLCFERVQSDLTEAVKEVFRAMMPAFNNSNKSVITPLLATGHQRADECEMLRTMVITAVKWMRLGLPLQTFKIVLYSINPQKSSSVDQDALELFKRLKKKVEYVRVIPQEPDIVLDIFLIYSDQDSELVSRFTKYLKKAKSNLKVRTVKDVQIKDDSWQHDLFNFMQTVARVVPILSTQFLFEGFCIDQFNVAICCNRLTKRHLLAPVLVERLSLPSYMNMVQWINCRSQTEEQFEEAAALLVSQIKMSKAPVRSMYDIFISYSHKNLSVAEKLLDRLQQLTPKPSVFFDYHQLTTGVAWQETLYKAIDNSRCMVALISPEYLQSSVCEEEFNIALFRHLGKNKDMELVPVCISELPDPEPSFCQFVKPVRTRGGGGDPDVATLLDSVCQALGDWLSTGTSPDIFSSVPEPLDYDKLSATIREVAFKESYQYNNDTVEIKTSSSDDTNSLPSQPLTDCDVFISHSVRDQKYATFLMENLQSVNPDLRITDKSKTAGTDSHLLDTARCLVVLLSPAYVNSTKEVEEFNIALSRERQTKDRRLLYVIKLKQLMHGPSYFSMIPCDTSLLDDIWWKLPENHSQIKQKHVKVLSVTAHKVAALDVVELCPLLKASCDILAHVELGRYPMMRHINTILDNIVTTYLLAEATVNPPHDDQDQEPRPASQPQPQPADNTTGQDDEELDLPSVDNMSIGGQSSHDGEPSAGTPERDEVEEAGTEAESAADTPVLKEAGICKVTIGQDGTDTEKEDKTSAAEAITDQDRSRTQETASSISEHRNQKTPELKKKKSKTCLIL